MSKGTPVSREKAYDLVTDELLKELVGDLKKWHICGSLRRGNKEIVNDIDVVAIPVEPQDRKSFTFTLEGGIQVDVNFTTEDSWGASTLMWTGTMELNVMMRRIAKGMRMKLNQAGLFDEQTGECVASKTEEEIFRYLGLKYLEPWEREIGWNDRLEKVGS